VLAGLVALLLLLAGVLFVILGAVQTREDRANALKDQAEAQQQAGMAADTARGSQLY
jgi:hypothetical protein